MYLSAPRDVATKKLLVLLHCGDYYCAAGFNDLERTAKRLPRSGDNSERAVVEAARVRKAARLGGGTCMRLTV